MTDLAEPPTGPTGRTAHGKPFRSLRHRNARRFFAGVLVSTIGTWLQLTAMALLVYKLTGKATDLGITLALQWLPMLVLGAWAGAVADRRDKLTLSIITQAGLAVQAIVLGVVDLAGLASVPVVWSLTLVLGVLNAFDNPARRGLVTELVETHEIPNATSLNTAVMTGSRIFGPALGALLVGTVGTAWCFLLNGMSFAAVLFSLCTIRRDEMHPSPRAPKGGRPVREALAYVAHRRRLLVVIVVMAIVSTFAFNSQVALPKLADVRWGGGVVRARAVGVERRCGDRLPAHRAARLGLDPLVSREHGADGRIRPLPGVGSEPRARPAVGDSVGNRRGGVHQRSHRHHPAGHPRTHARAHAGADGRGVPRLDADRRADHRDLSATGSAPSGASPTAVSSHWRRSPSPPSC